MRIAYLECFAGVSGDMFLGALLDAGVPLALLEEAVDALAIDASLRVERVDRSGIVSTKVHVLEAGHLAEDVHEHEHSHKRDHHHEHGEKHEHSHDHEHRHEDAHSEHEHAHAHGEHSHAHEHKHDEDHKHSHDHDHEKPHKDEHGHVHKHSHDHEHPHTHGRSLSQIRALILAAPLAEAVKQRAIKTFELLGHSEAKIHEVPLDEIHFHEVGAVDAIVDIVAASAGIEHLQRAAPVTWFCSPLNVGGGMVECAHGTFPVPAPATADLLRGMPTYSAHLEKELVTPTGAAILRALAPSFNPRPQMQMDTIGYGAGTRNPKRFPNVLRLSLGDTSAAGLSGTTADTDSAETVLVLETALDDASPQLLAQVAERLLAAGALDVMLAPVLMKKGRPGTLMTVLCAPPDAATFEAMLLRETTTLGLRKRIDHRSCLARRHVSVATSYGELRVKIGSLGEEDVNAAPEFEDCRAAAEQHGVPVKLVVQAALAAYLANPLGAVVAE